ncbi:MAG: WYL domain-containing protein [Clostridiales bacterium]|nr:WYL domain-containing protein [Clostridiales bacterium]
MGCRGFCPRKDEVDKMLHIKTVNELRQGKSRFQQFDMAQYAKKMFGMYGGREEVVKLRCANDLVGAIIDRFEKDIPIRKEDEAHFTVNVHVEMSNQFIHWVMALGSGAQIIGPASVVEEVKAEIGRMGEQYL